MSIHGARVCRRCRRAQTWQLRSTADGKRRELLEPSALRSGCCGRRPGARSCAILERQSRVGPPIGQRRLVPRAARPVTKCCLQPVALLVRACSRAHPRSLGRCGSLKSTPLHARAPSQLCFCSWLSTGIFDGLCSVPARPASRKWPRRHQAPALSAEPPP